MVDASIPMSRYSEIRISSTLDGNKSPLITVIVPGTTLFDLPYEEFVKMVTDYAVAHVPSSKKHVTT